MDQHRNLELAWTQGYGGQELFYIDSDVICYQCGRKVKILNENGSETVFDFHGNGVGPFAVHRFNRIFAIAERCIDPRIFIYDYPKLHERLVLKGGAKIEFQKLVFSASKYFLSLSSLPDFEMVLWDCDNGDKLTSVHLSSEAPTSIAFNPCNWRQICVTTRISLTVWNIEQSNRKFILLPQDVKLPAEDGSDFDEDEKDCDVANVQFAVKKSKYAVNVPFSSMEGLNGELYNCLLEMQEQTSRISPVAQAWTATGDIFISSDKGHLLKVDGENYQARIIYYPSVNIPRFRSHSNLSQEEDDQVTSPGRGSLNCLGLHRAGLFAAGEDGVLRLLIIKGEDVQVARTQNINVPITSLVFSSNYLKIAFGSSRGSIVVTEALATEKCQIVADTHFGNFVSVGVLAADSNVCVTVREDGMTQAWSITSGSFLSALTLEEPASCITCSPLSHFAVVGSVNGQVYFVDFTSVGEPRIVHRLRLYCGPVKILVFDQDGKFLISGGDDHNVFVFDGRPSTKFSLLGFVAMGHEVTSVSALSRKTMVQVVMAVNSGKQTNASDLIVSFKLTEGILSDESWNYNSVKKDFKDDVIDKMTFTLVEPSVGIALGVGTTAYTIAHASRKLQIHSLPPAAPETKEVIDLPPEFLIAGHQLQGGQVLLSPHLKWLASYAPDGYVIIRRTNNLDETVTICAHDYKYGGVHDMAFSKDCESIITVGYDGVLCCYKWKQDTVEGKHSPADIYAGCSSPIGQLLQAEDAALSDLETWCPPSPLSRSPSVIAMEKKKRAEEMKKEALENEEIYRTPTPEPEINCTWLEQKEFEAQREEEKKYADTKAELRHQIREIRKTIQGMIKSNEDLPEIEKLSRHEFDLDVDEQARLQAEGEAAIEQAQEEIEFDNLAKHYLREVIKKECWDNMKIKGRSIKAFNSELEVANFPLLERPRAAVSELEKVQSRRRIEIRELEFRKREVDPPAKTLHTSGDEESGDLEEEEFNTEHPSITGSLGASYGGGSELFYSQFDLHLRHQKINQIVLLKDAIYRIKVVFNREFEDIYSKKEQEISKIKEKNKRIAKILSDIDLDEKMVVPEMDVCEKPERLLTVEDSEIKVEKYLTPAQQQKLLEQQKAEEERRLREKGDNQRERALDMMMGGVLEIRKEDELKKDVPVPLFMQQKADTDWTEEEHKMAKEYERKVKELNEEREKFRKQLETELRKLQGAIADHMSSFDDTLNQLFLKKIKVMMVLYQEELKIQRLRCSLLTEEEMEAQERELLASLEHKRKLKTLASEAVNEARSSLEDFRNEYDILVAEDKVMDKAFKREFNDVSAFMADQLYRLFRKRPRGQKFKMADTPLVDGKSPNPYAERPSTARQNDQIRASVNSALDEMDKASNMPEGLDPSIWQRMCTYRRTKIDSETMIKQKALTLAEMQAFLQKRQEEDETLKSEIEDLNSRLNSLKEDQLKFFMNLEVQLLLKQGQVEVDAGEFVHDFSDSVLVHRSVIEDLNNTIKQLGESKIASMVESKDFRKGIIQLEWEHKKMSMQMEDLENKMKDIQSMKVTREIQAYLNESDYEAKKSAEIATLEQTILMQKKHHEKKVAEKKQIMADLRKTIKNRDGQNLLLEKDLEELNVTVNERRHIEQVNAMHRLDTGAERRYQEIVQRRKLVDLAKAQAQEVAVLRAEVERLRMRTFPALVQVEH